MIKSRNPSALKYLHQEVEIDDLDHDLSDLWKLVFLGSSPAAEHLRTLVCTVCYERIRDTDANLHRGMQDLLCQMAEAGSFEGAYDRARPTGPATSLFDPSTKKAIQNQTKTKLPVSYTHLTLPTIYSV